MLTAADARTNTSSANYKAGYDAGVASVTVSASASGRTVTATASNGKTTSASVAYAGSNGTVSVSTSGGSGNQSFDITDGWCTKINVDRTGAYNAGYNAGRTTVKSGSKDYNYVSNGSHSFTVPGTVVSAGILKMTHGEDGRWVWGNYNRVSWSGNTVTFNIDVGVENASGRPNVTVSYAYY